MKKEEKLKIIKDWLYSLEEDGVGDYCFEKSDIEVIEEALKLLDSFERKNFDVKSLDVTIDGVKYIPDKQ